MATPSSQKPAIIIVHGAWSLPSPSYSPLKQQLEGLGYECYLPHLRTSGGSDEVRGQTWEADVQVILDTALPLFERGREVVIVAHSYGGVPGGAATKGNGVAERAREGKAGGFRQIIYVAAFAIPASGMDLLAVFGGQWPPWAEFAPAYSKVCRREVTPFISAPFSYSCPCARLPHCGTVVCR
jgi:pimeloyl-ACP methyl ester carboxylesterase